MPQYHGVVELECIGKRKRKVVITPLPGWRRFTKLFLPYFVGQTEKFRLDTIGENEFNGKFMSFYILEFFGDRKLEPSYEVNKTPFEFVGRILDSEANVKYSIGALPSQDTYTVMTTQVYNTDRWGLGCAGAVFGMIMAIIGQIILRFILVEPAWRVWIPDWILNLLQ